MYKEVDGDLIKMALNGEFDVIGHGCNCFHAMGSGIAAGIKRFFPEAYEADKGTLKGKKSKLGTVSYGQHGDLTIANMYTQFHWSKIAPDGKLKPTPRGTVLLDYGALTECMDALYEKYKDKDVKIGLPMIGAGLARGDWNAIKEIIQDMSLGIDVTVVRYKP
jgi:O-acetyl-ADP-ribose deacetylase (regulator of RNase III)